MTGAAVQTIGSDPPELPATTPGDAATHLQGFGIRLPVGGEAVELSYSVLDAAPVGMALADATGELLWVNAALCRLLGLSREDLLSSGLPEVVDGEDLPGTSGHRVVGALVRDATEVEQLWQVGCDEPAWMAVSISPAVDSDGRQLRTGGGGEAVYIHQVFNVDARRRAEAAAADARAELERRNAELERSNTELAEFAYVVSHDLSEPLRVIAGHVQLLSDRYHGQLDEEADAWIGFAVDGATRMRRLIDSLLTYSRAGRGELGPTAVQTSDVVRGALAGLQAAVDDSHAVVTVGELPTVTANATDLGRIFSNLIGNALKFHRPGHAPVIEVGAHRKGDSWVFTVADNGIGIAERHRERAFRLFQRLNTRDSYEGTGLGLAICRKLVTRLGGEIGIDESPLGGSTFWFTVPDQNRAAA